MNKFLKIASTIAFIFIVWTGPVFSSDQSVKQGTFRSDQEKNDQFAIHKSADDSNLFEFETKKMRGKIRVDGAYHGVTELVDKATGRQVIDSRYSALNLFRLMSVNRFMDKPRTMERSVKSSTHWVEIAWPSSTKHLGEIKARYEIVSPKAIDLTVTIESKGTYAGYELFLSSYFDKKLIPHVYLKPPRGAKQVNLDSKPATVPTMNEVFRGLLLVFPRDSLAAKFGLDGRWDPDTIKLCPVRHYANCMALLTDPEKKLGVVLMSHPRDCFAFSTRYHAERKEDRLTSYSAFDFSLFGKDLLPGRKQVVKIRLALTELDKKMTQPLELYRSYISERNSEQDSVN